MDVNIAQLIVQDRGIVYVITDRNLKVLEIHDTSAIFYDNNQEPDQGLSILDIVPELIGNEYVLADILNGDLPRFQLNWVNRETITGQTRYLTMVDLPHRDQTGQITGLIHLVEDVTEIGLLSQQLTQQRNELELIQEQLVQQKLELAATNAELQRLADMKSSFVSIAAHELRTPLSSISGYVEMLLDEDFDLLTHTQRRYLETVQRSTERLLTITKNLLDVTRIESGRIELLLQPTDLLALIKTTVAEFQPLLESKAQQLSVNISPNLPPALCDPSRVVQIINNLLSNASKYTPNGGHITLSLSSAEEAGFLQISVADDGVGISVRDQAGLFKRFFRAKNANSMETTGTGLGLYITRSLVELHGGQIWLESELNNGSTFYITLPTAEGQ